MTPDLWFLVATVVLCLVMPTVYVGARGTVKGGNAWGFGNRDRPLEGVPEWGRRAERAHANLLENLSAFAAIVLVAHVSGHANRWTALGAGIFFAARVLYTIIYVAGVVGWRTAVFTAGTGGMALIASQLVV